MLYICTGSQGEPRAALTRIAQDDHPHVVLEEGDTVIFSSRIIPGNERAIGRLHNKLDGLGVEILTENDHFVHVSGHPAQEELRRMYQMVRPRVSVPVHGELRHLNAHAALAREVQVEQAIVALNGDMVRLGPLPAALIGRVPTGRWAVDGTRILPLGGEAWKNRQRMALNGAAVATVVVNSEGKLLAEPRIAIQGLGEPDAALWAELGAGIEKAVAGLSASGRRDDMAVSEAARLVVRRMLKASHGKRPVTEIHVVRI